MSVTVTATGGGVAAHTLVVHEAPAAPAPPPFTLERASEHFLGRQDHTDRLRRILTDPDRGARLVLICAVDGMAGIGKSALASHAAHAVSASFPDGCLWIDLHGYTAGVEALTPGAALRSLLFQWGVDSERVPEGTDDRMVMWRRELAHKRVLLVLDNARDAAQVGPLLPGTPGSAVLITSRSRISSLADTERLPLDELSHEDALDLFRAVAGAELVSTHLPAVEMIARQCGYLPLAIRLIAPALRDTAWPAELLTDLSKEYTRLMELEDDRHPGIGTALRVSDEALTEAQRRMFRMLGLIPGPDFELHAAAAVSGTSPSEARRLLDALAGASLLLGGGGRMHFHDLVREYARRLAGDEIAPRERADALSRLLYASLATAYASGLLLPAHEMHVGDRPAGVPASTWEPSTEEQARTWLEAEQANLLQLVTTTGGRESARLGFIVGHGLFELGVSESAHTCYAHAAAQFAALDRDEDRQGRAESEAGLGLCAMRSGRYDDARRHYLAAGELSGSIGDTVGRAHAQRLLGHMELRLGHHTEAEAAFTAADATFARLDQPVGHAQTQRGLGHIARHRGRHAEAKEHYRAADRIFLATGDRIGHAHTLRALAGIALHEGDHEAAERLYGEADRIYLDARLDVSHGAAVWGMGRVALAAGRHEDAARRFTEARDVYRQVGDRAYEATAERDLGETALRSGDHDAAAAHFGRSLRIRHHRRPGPRRHPA
ncbi:tetratricopeptide repeat protein [Streptomyces sp. NPDC099050]|uniref:tetratricopeptide repeat protein n=1 Tax=Streptomyces sp. NPDC099050 TaxID=3366100 RepID=UPI003808EB80